MKQIRQGVVAFGCALAALAAGSSAFAQISGDVIRIGFITDISGLYSDIDGEGGEFDHVMDSRK